MALPDAVDPKQTAPPVQTSGVYVVDLDEAAFRKLLVSGMAMQQQLTLAAGRYRLRLGVADIANNRIGTLDMPIEVAASGASKGR
jgi:hypothetical protein